MHFAPWYRRNEYALIREIMDDGEDSFPLSFDEWERNAESERASAKLEGTDCGRLAFALRVLGRVLRAGAFGWRVGRPTNNKRGR